MSAPLTASLIAAVARNGVIGAGDGLPWHLPDDLKRFRAITWDKPVIMGRRTFDGIGKVLPGRRWIVLTRDPAWSAPKVWKAPNLEQALADAATPLLREEASEVLVAGGAQVYRAAWPRCDRLYLTRIEADIPGDVSFPIALDPMPEGWRLISDEPGSAAAPLPHRFQVYERSGS